MKTAAPSQSSRKAGDVRQNEATACARRFENGQTERLVKRGMHKNARRVLVVVIKFGVRQRPKKCERLSERRLTFLVHDHSRQREFPNQCFGAIAVEQREVLGRVPNSSRRKHERLPSIC